MKQTIVDQLGTQISVHTPARRIISLVPSQTEFLFDLGLDVEVLGITKFCVHPMSWRSAKTIVGGTKNFWFDVIDQLQPDLVIGNKEENYSEGILKIREQYPVWMSDIETLENAYAMMQSIGVLTGRESQANEIIAASRAAFVNLRSRPLRRTLYLIWSDPWMAAGKRCFIDSLLEQIGLSNCISADRYPTLTDAALEQLSPELLLLSSEPFPFKGIHAERLRKILPNAKIAFVDGEMFSWYGSRLRLSPAYFNTLDF